MTMKKPKSQWLLEKRNIRLEAEIAVLRERVYRMRDIFIDVLDLTECKKCQKERRQ